MKGDILDIQQVECSGNSGQTTAYTTRTRMFCDAAQTRPFTIAYTPPTNVWWEVYAHQGIAWCDDASWLYAYTEIEILPAVSESSNYPTSQQTLARSIETYHNTATYSFRAVHGWFQLSQGIPYTACAWMIPAGGTHRQRYDPESNYMWAIAYES